jgi:hypothetical protein
VKSPAVLLAAHRERDLEDGARAIALRHHVTLFETFSDSRAREIVEARRAIWTWEVDELGSLNAVARLWGADRSSMLAADVNAESPISFVLLAELRTEDRHFRFSYFADRDKKFTIANVLSGRVSSFETYETARVFWQQSLDLAGVTFLSQSKEIANAAGGAS